MAIYVLRRGKAEAYGYPLSLDPKPGFVVTQGSTALREGPALEKRGREDTDALVRDGVLVDHPTERELYLFDRDYEFGSSSRAGTVINDGNFSGPRRWLNTTTGASLKADLEAGIFDRPPAALDAPADPVTEIAADDVLQLVSADVSIDQLNVIERKYRSATPEVKARVSRYIERGAVGTLVKRMNGFKCQVCEALGMDPIGFRKPSGEPYVEAHHVMQISKLEAGSLAASNILTACANHHRQLHYGDVEVRISAHTFEVTLDGRALSITRPTSSIGAM